jgi:cyclohexadienyl dehydratase
MDEVAAYKWREGLPIEDPAREAVVLEEGVTEALRHGLTAASSRALFEAQIEAAKTIQQHWFEMWTARPGPAEAPDLNAEIRPELLRLGDAIVAAAAHPRRLAAADHFAATVDVVGLDVEARAALLEAVRGLERYPHRLAQILDVGVVRIGTTGDYAPFSHRDGDGDVGVAVGIDAELGRRLADALGVRVQFVATSWPTLMADLAERRFDIAMSGVSRTVERQRHGMFSRPYYVGGKTPIARCEAADGFDALAAIDRPGVRVVVNPGGTNERFVDTHIHRADKILHGDNRTIFQVLVDGGADVMITDRVEVELQSARHPQLCATMADTLTYQEKAYLLPQDPVWQGFVDTWLDLALADGTVARIFRDHGVEPRLP